MYEKMRINWPELFKVAATQPLYDCLIAAKNEWNARVARGEVIPAPSSELHSAPMKKVYLHFENQRDRCACGDGKKIGTHGTYACTVRE